MRHLHLSQSAVCNGRVADELSWRSLAAHGAHAAAHGLVHSGELVPDEYLLAARLHGEIGMDAGRFLVRYALHGVPFSRGEQFIAVRYRELFWGPRGVVEPSPCRSRATGRVGRSTIAGAGGTRNLAAAGSQIIIRAAEAGSPRPQSSDVPEPEEALRANHRRRAR